MFAKLVVTIHKNKKINVQVHGVKLRLKFQNRELMFIVWGS